jgi:hypothetical protein
MSAVRAALLDWVRAHRRGPADAPLDADTPLLQDRLLTSLQLPELLLFIEQLSGRPLEVASIRPGAFARVAAIERHFFPTGPDAA